MTGPTSNTEPRPTWLIRAGRSGEDEENALTQGLAIIGFHDIGDLSGIKSLQDLISISHQVNPGDPERRSENRARQLWAFRDTIREGDVVVLPLKSRPGQIALGRVAGPYRYIEIKGEKRHTRQVAWTHPDIPRSTFQQDLLYSFGAFMTVCRITRNDAERRVGTVVLGKSDPGYPVDGKLSVPTVGPADSGPIAPQSADLAQAAHDEITAFVRKRFHGHDMARLVDALLRADGFVTYRSPPGPDGGADILAGRGPLGLDAPTLCVQVKATEAPADVTIFRALQGTMTTFSAEQGLLVCWGGFTLQVKTEARQHTFRIRLWDQSDLVQAVYRAYERLPEEIQAELPLKRAWILVRDELETGE